MMNGNPLEVWQAVDRIVALDEQRFDDAIADAVELATNPFSLGRRSYSDRRGAVRPAGGP